MTKDKDMLFMFRLEDTFDVIEVAVYDYEPGSNNNYPGMNPENMEEPIKEYFDYYASMTCAKLQHRKICNAIRSVMSNPSGDRIMIVRNFNDRKTFDVVILDGDDRVVGYAAEGVSFEEAQIVQGSLNNLSEIGE